MNNKTAEIITNKFLESIASTKKLPWQKPWRSVALRNAKTRARYKGVNVLMLALFGKDTDFMTYNQAKEAGGFVKAGSKGIPICFFKFMDKKDENGVPITKNGKLDKWPLLRYSTVFNLCDIEGADSIKAKCNADKKAIDFAPIEACEKLVAAGAIKTNHGGDSSHYSPGIHAITLPAPESFKSVPHYYATSFHELGHAMAKETGEDISSGFGSDPYAKEELVAELFANFCLSFVGIDSSDLFNNSAAYLQSWTSKLTKDPTLLISAASKASKRFNLLLEKGGFNLEAETETEEIAA